MPSNPKQNPIPGYTSKQQPDGLDATVAGIGTSANPEEFKDDAALRTVEHPENSKADGDAPSMPTTLKFAGGPDVRNNY